MLCDCRIVQYTFKRIKLFLKLFIYIPLYSRKDLRQLHIMQFFKDINKEISRKNNYSQIVR